MCCRVFKIKRSKEVGWWLWWILSANFSYFQFRITVITIKFYLAPHKPLGLFSTSKCFLLFKDLKLYYQIKLPWNWMEETLWQRTKTASLLQIIITNGLVTNIFHITWNDSRFKNSFKYSTVLTIILSWKIGVCTIPSSKAEI